MNFLCSLQTKISGIKLLFQKVFSTNIISVVQFSVFGLLITYWDTTNCIKSLLPYSNDKKFFLFLIWECLTSTTLAADEGKSTLIDIFEKPVPIGILIDSFCASWDLIYAAYCYNLRCLLIIFSRNIFLRTKAFQINTKTLFRYSKARQGKTNNIPRSIFS